MMKFFTLFLALFFGPFGFHRFFVGQKRLGFVYIGLILAEFISARLEADRVFGFLLIITLIFWGYDIVKILKTSSRNFVENFKNGRIKKKIEPNISSVQIDTVEEQPKGTFIRNSDEADSLLIQRQIVQNSREISKMDNAQDLFDTLQFKSLIATSKCILINSELNELTPIILLCAFYKIRTNFSEMNNNLSSKDMENIIKISKANNIKIPDIITDIHDKFPLSTQLKSIIAKQRWLPFSDLIVSLMKEISGISNPLAEDVTDSLKISNQILEWLISQDWYQDPEVESEFYRNTIDASTKIRSDMICTHKFSILISKKYILNCYFQYFDNELIVLTAIPSFTVSPSKINALSKYCTSVRRNGGMFNFTEDGNVYYIDARTRSEELVLSDHLQTYISALVEHVDLTATNIMAIINGDTLADKLFDEVPTDQITEPSGLRNKGSDLNPTSTKKYSGSLLQDRDFKTIISYAKGICLQVKATELTVSHALCALWINSEELMSINFGESQKQLDDQILILASTEGISMVDVKPASDDIKIPISSTLKLLIASNRNENFPIFIMELLNSAFPVTLSDDGVDGSEKKQTTKKLDDLAEGSKNSKDVLGFKFQIVLGKTYYRTGYLNPGPDASEFLGEDDEPLNIQLGSGGPIIQSRIDRKANANASVRVIGKNRVISDWFQNNFKEGDTVIGTVIDRNTILLFK
jgi:hypothetical protein